MSVSYYQVIPKKVNCFALRAIDNLNLMAALKKLEVLYDSLFQMFRATFLNILLEIYTETTRT